jgi:hypothetical protein
VKWKGKDEKRNKESFNYRDDPQHYWNR